jgi:G3E family GTPase
MSAPAAATPFVLLTGFLGAGKTTVLNRALAVSRHRRLAVIVNELGRIDVDGKLLRARSGDVLELVGGCVCHEVQTQEQLWRAVDEILDRAAADLVVLETTGIAEPAAIVAGLDELPAARRRVELRGVITVVDATAGLGQLERHPEARAQVLAADRLLLSKLDLAAPSDVVALHAALGALNAGAERAAFPPDEAGSLALAAWLEEPGASGASPAGARARGLAGAPHAHGQLVAAAIADDHPLLAEPLLALCRGLGPALVRAKGFVRVAGAAGPGFLERAGNQLSLSFGADWPAGAPRRTELVLIGEGLDPAAVQRQVWACRARGEAGGP